MAKAARILIVDDEPAIREMIGFALIGGGFAYVEAEDAEQARAIIAADPPDLVLLDWMLPGLSGLELAQYLQKDPLTCKLPIIMVTARDEETSMVRGLETGADDYITKPFSPRQLLARIKAVLRRAGTKSATIALEVNGLYLDPDTHRVRIGDRFLEMGPTEFRLLHFFMTHRERVYSRAQLIDMVWDPHAYVEERTVDVHIRRLRKVLEPSGHDRLIQTVRGAGYRFSKQE